MTATLAKRPAFCPYVYHDNETLFLEFDSGMVLCFTFTEGGLHKALQHIPNVTKQPGFLSGRSNILAKVLPSIKIAKATKHKREVKAATNISEAVKNAATALIRKKLGGGTA